jgi:hypothetical protein
MAFTKTRIWRGGLTDMEPLAGAAPAPPAGTAEAPSCSPEQIEVFERSAARIAASDAPPGLDPRPPSPLATTRFLPIEQLFPEQQRKTREPVELTPVVFRRRVTDLFVRLRARAVRYENLTVRRRPVRRVLFLALLIAITAAAAVALPMAERQLGAVHAASARSATRVQKPAAPALDPEEPAQARAPADAHVESDRTVRSATKPQGLERSAIDALISGDLTRAAQLYGRLADGAPEEPVYREARRILLNLTSSP